MNRRRGDSTRPNGMTWQRLRIPLILMSAVVWSSVGLAAQDKQDVRLLTPSASGSTGLFHLARAETLRRGEFSFSLSGFEQHREPGDLDLTFFPVTFTFGLHDRMELFASWQANRQVHAGHLSPPGPTLSFFNDTPFLNTGFGSGPGELSAGLKLNLKSEFRGDPLSLALQPRMKFALADSAGRLARGLTNGVNELALDAILTRTLGTGGAFTSSLGLQLAGETRGVRLQNRVNYGLGLELPFGTRRIRIIAELAGSTFWGRRTALANPRSALDLNVGARLYPRPWLALSAGASRNFRHIDPSLYGIDRTGNWGWFVQAAWQRKINRPPAAECFPAAIRIAVGENATIDARIRDPDDSLLSLVWTAGAGRIRQQGTSALFDASGLEAGTYTVLLKVSDGRHTATCSTDITVVDPLGQYSLSQIW